MAIFKNKTIVLSLVIMQYIYKNNYVKRKAISMNTVKKKVSDRRLYIEPLQTGSLIGT
jgi:hypothetical protein